MTDAWDAFAKALKTAPEGSALEVPAGFADRGLSVTRRLAIRGAPGAVVASLVVSGSGATVEDLAVRFTPTAKTALHTPAVKVTGARGVRLTRLSVEGGVAPADGAGGVLKGHPVGRGVSVEFSQDVAIEACLVRSFHKGIIFARAGDVAVRGCDVGHVRTGTISGGGLTGPVVIEGNRLHDSNPVNLGGSGDHADFIHFWTDPGVTRTPTAGVRIVDNLLDEGEGQGIIGISLDDNRNGIGFTGAVIVGNTVLTSGSGGGISLENTEALVENNVLLQTSGDGWRDAPSIYFGPDSRITARGNYTADGGKRLARLPTGAEDNTIIAGGIQPAEALELARWMWTRRR